MSAVLENVAHGSMGYNRGCRCDECRAWQRRRVAANRAARRKNPASHGTRSSYDAGCRCEECRAARVIAYRSLASEYPAQAAQRQEAVS